MKKKIILISIYVLALALFVAAGSTIAWLVDVSDEPLVNVFAPSNIDVELKETTTTYKMIPGTPIDKDPTVYVSNDIDCYVFLKVEETANFGTYMTYDLVDEWLPLEGYSGIYYRVVAAGSYNSTVEFPVIEGNKVYVPNSVTKEDMNALYNADGTVNTDAQPKLTFTAAAVQKDNLSVSEAYGQVVWPTN